MIYRVQMTFTEPLLGGSPLSAKVFEQFLAGRRGEETPDNPLASDEIEEELATLPEGERGGVTGFHRLPDGSPMIYDYVIKGFAKDACAALGRIKTSRSAALKAYKRVIDGLLHIYPRRIPLVLAGPVTEMTRPLRAQTMQGERVALATSEMVPAGSSMEFEILPLSTDVIPDALIREWLGYGQFKGLGQWRNASWGRFAVQVETVTVGKYAPSLVY